MIARCFPRYYGLYERNVSFRSIIIPYFWIHSFEHGYIYVIYSVEGRDDNGKLMCGSWRIPSKWTIDRINGQWVITDIDEPA